MVSAKLCWLNVWQVFTHPTAGTLVITHEQTLLQTFTCLLELRHGQLHWHGQGFNG